MNKKNEPLTENSKCDLGKIPFGKYRAYFEKVLNKKFGPGDLSGDWFNAQTGKTLKEAINEYIKNSEPKSIEQLLSEERFNFVSLENKNYIIEFTKQINLMDYDFGGIIGSGFLLGNYMVDYKRQGIKTKKVIARIAIRDGSVIIWGGKEYKYDNCIVLKLHLSNVDKHEEFIKNKPSHIKQPLTIEYKNCVHCMKGKCLMRRIHVINDKEVEKCGVRNFEWINPKMEYIKDFMDIIREFYGKRGSKSKKQKTCI